MDDHPAVRRGIASMLEDMGWFVGIQAESLTQARLLALAQPWDLAVIDLHLPDGEGCTFIKELRDAGVTKPILVHSQVPDTAAAKRVFDCGGNGFLNKGSSVEEFEFAARKVASGKKYISQSYAEVLAEGMCRGASSQLHDNLSEREHKVMCLIALGKRPAEIAEVLDCSVNTISSYRARVLQKLALKTTMDIARYALSHKLVAL